MTGLSKAPTSLWQTEGNYLNDRQELLDLTRLYRFDLQLNLFGVILRSGRLKFKVEG